MTGPDASSADDFVNIAVGKMIDGDSEEFFALFDGYPAHYSIAAIFGLLAMLVERKHGPDRGRAQLIHYAGVVHANGPRRGLPPRSVIEAVLRAAGGEGGMLAPARSLELLEAAGYVLRFLISDLNRSSGDRAELIAAASVVVARTPEVLAAEE
jgi:hypothetical protein